ncbi:MAG: aspartate/glutamate racemase family protein [Planctomycetota bacterium]|nr:aspartate/glutamate racemase family protein [Verrucomicrobiota bacterium]MDI9442968.1 aspartate/glutamate racemase family protein [Planctomycetota bacterium]
MNALGQPVFGVIGGAGVAAGARLAARLEERVTALGGFRDAHHPELILWQATSAPSRSLFLENRGPDFTPVYERIGRHLRDCGADVFCMACNAAHARAAEISRAVGLPMIHLLDETFGAVRRRWPEVRKVGVLCSTGSRDARIFDRSAAGLELGFADDEVQGWITAGICGVKNRNRFLPEGHPDRPRTQFRRACERLVRDGAQALVLACADIGVDFPDETVAGAPVVDSLAALADAMLDHWLRHGRFERDHPLHEAARAAKGQG